MKRIDPKLETQILALITRGDSYPDIQRQLTSEGHEVSTNTLVAIKQRNKETLQYMKNALVQHEVHKSAQLLDKSRRLLERKLNRALQVDDKLSQLKEMLAAGEIDPREYEVLVKVELKNDVSVAVLTGLSKELFTQSRIEANKDPDKPESPDDARQKLKELLEAVQEKDEQKIVKAIFPDA